jgi:hypothetical protein
VKAMAPTPMLASYITGTTIAVDGGLIRGV